MVKEQEDNEDVDYFRNRKLLAFLIRKLGKTMLFVSFALHAERFILIHFLLVAINECGLVYDGGLVVGPMFDTNDPHIYGAGTCVTYSRRLYASRWLHRYYHSEDVGEAVCISI